MDQKNHLRLVSLPGPYFTTEEAELFEQMLGDYADHQRAGRVSAKTIQWHSQRLHSLADHSRKCQSASKIDPPSASKSDPPQRLVLVFSFGF